MNELRISGLQKTTLLDYPGHVAATIFLHGCNFRCPFCHNADLLGGDYSADADFDADATSTAQGETGAQAGPASSEPDRISREEVLAFLKKRSGILEGVCITGGEPTLQPEALEDFIREVRSLGLLVKLDTNGARPKVIRDLAAKGLLDCVAMDIKAAPEHYPQVCGVAGVNLDAIKESVSWLLAGTLPCEFRTTVVKGLHTGADFEQIGPWIAGCSHYYLQNYVASERVLYPDGFDSFSKAELLAFADMVKPYVGQVLLRGIDY